MKRATTKAARPPNGNRTSPPSVVTLTRQQLEERAERAAQDLLQVTRLEAFKMLEGGRLQGTLAEAVLTPIHDLLAE